MGEEEDIARVARHEEVLKTIQRDTVALQEQVYGLPQRMEALEKAVKESISRMEEQQKMYQTKDLCLMCTKEHELKNTTLASEQEKMKLEYDKKFDNLERLINGTTWKIIYGLGMAVVSLVVFIFMNHDKFAK